MVKIFLKEILKEKNMTMTELHQKTGISMKSLSFFANQKTESIQFKNIKLLSEFLNVEINDLFTFIDDIYDISIKLVGIEKAVIIFEHRNIKQKHQLNIKYGRKITQLGEDKILSVTVREVNKEDWLMIKEKMLIYSLTDEDLLKILGYILTESIVLEHYKDILSMFDDVYFTWKGSGLLPILYTEMVNNELLNNLNEKITYSKQTYLINLVPRNPNLNLKEKEFPNERNLAVDFKEIVSLQHFYDIEYGNPENNWQRKVSICLI